MGEVLTMNPPCHFGFDVPFQVKDGFNGPSRGTWWFRSKKDGTIVGPFHSWAIARLTQQQEDMKLGYLK
ncbi:hypothetical protein [Erythrobacter phage vB_EliS-L02]|nr:hypothetical protein [Erythrobacter phage vB_EliS-L02]